MKNEILNIETPGKSKSRGIPFAGLHPWDPILWDSLLWDSTRAKEIIFRYIQEGTPTEELHLRGLPPVGLQKKICVLVPWLQNLLI